jgi:hypothetical protein
MRASVFFAVVVVACGKPPEPPPPQLTVVTGTGDPGSALAQSELDAPGTVTALGLTQEGDLVVVADGLVYQRVAGELVLKNLYAEASDPQSLGAVKQIVPRVAGGAWLAADNGLFMLEGDYVSHSPVMAGMGPLAGASEAPKGILTGLWLAASDGVYRRTPQDTQRYDVDGYAQNASAIAAEQTGAGAFALLGPSLVLLTPGDTVPQAALPPDDVGGVQALAGGSGALFAATDRGVFRWKPALTPAWTRFALDGTGALDLQLDPVSGAAWVMTATALIRIDGDAITSFARPDGTQLLAVDRLGDLVTAKGATLVQLKTGAGAMAATFSADMKPFIEAHCVMCHADFTDVAAFSQNALEALQRVRSGDMPRCNGGLPCPADQHLSPDQYAVLEAWIRGGEQP